MIEKLTHRERAKIVLNHREADRILIDFMGTCGTLITEDAYIKLANYLGISYKKGQGEVDDFFIMNQIDEKILLDFDVDFKRIYFKGWPKREPQIQQDGTYTDYWGLIRKRARNKYGANYSEMVNFIFSESDEGDIENYQWPKYEKNLSIGLKKWVEDIYYNSNYSIVAGLNFPGGIFEMSLFLRGFDKFLTDLKLNKKFAHRLMNRIYEMQVDFYDPYLDIVGEYIDVVEYSDDLGTQHGPFMSLELYREMIKPYHKRLFSFLKSKTNAKILMHSCGSVDLFINDLVEIGLDIIQAVQPLAYSMDPFYLKKKYGNNIVFWGGIDVQQAIPRGTVKDVEGEVIKRIEAFAPDGGFVLAPAHNFQVDTPPENIIALYKNALKYGNYPIKF